jgi:twitching motility protein PilT
MQNILQTGSKLGMQMLDNCLVDLVKKGLVTVDEAVAKAHHPDVVRRSCSERAPVGAGTAGV